MNNAEPADRRYQVLDPPAGGYSERLVIPVDGRDVDGAKFRKPVVPGDVLELRVVKQKQRKNIFKYHCEAWVGAEKAAEADIGAMMVDPSESD